MILTIATIPHTGSRLLVDEILGAKWQNLKYKPVDGVNYFEHIYTHNTPLHKMRMEQYPSIVTLRHPQLVATSWKKRGLDIDEMCICWYILVEMLDKYEPYYLPVDSKDRDVYLDTISKGIGIDLKTDWPMTNSKHNTQKAEHLGEDQESVDKLCENIKPFLKRFYPRKPTCRKPSQK